MIHLKKHGMTACCGHSGYGDMTSVVDEVTCKKCMQSVYKKDAEKKRRDAYVTERSKVEEWHGL